MHSAWRLPEADPRAFIDVQHCIRVAQIAERGKLLLQAGGSADGFNLMPDALPSGIEDPVDGMVPLLQQTGRTPCDHLWLARPRSCASVCSHGGRRRQHIREPRCMGRPGSADDMRDSPALPQRWRAV